MLDINNISQYIDLSIEQQEEELRPHFGCSSAGGACDRLAWLKFRWAVIPKHSGRIKRIFRRGHNEEKFVIDDLAKIGIKVAGTGNDRINVNFGSHVSGTLDGVAYINNEKYVLEIKTHNKKSFKELTETNSIKKSHTQHYIQVQLYMLGTNINKSLYYAVCKDNDEIYTEVVHFDKDIASEYLNKAKKVALADRPAPRLSDIPSWYVCKMCDAHDFCHVTKLTKEVNCRTCAHSTAMEDGSWHCVRWHALIPSLKDQINACDDHILHPDLTPWEPVISDKKWQAVYLIDNRKVKNGAKIANDVFTSKELVINASACADNSPMSMSIKNDFNGVIVG